MAFNDNCLISIMFLLCANIFIVYKTISQDKDNQYYINESIIVVIALFNVIYVIALVGLMIFNYQTALMK
ncbi:hypothetical protein ACTQX2_02200 [Megamonas funiformis]|jgi:hypothetical protein|uniref:hypothetical protein n=1 Tax=Megamonas funiformis TaxID=437897 RepID=UPI003F9C0A8E